MADQQNLQLYSFSVHEPEREVATYACVAPSLAQARRSAAFIGYKNVILLEARDVEGMEVSTHARERAALNPLLGEEWLPLLDLMAQHFTLHKPGRTWVMEVYPHDEPFQEDNPYAQAVLLPEGSVHLQIGPTALLEEKYELPGEFLEFLGWSPPVDSHSPNFSVTFTPGISVEYIAATALQALVVLMDVSTKDGFSLSGVGGAVKQVIPGIESLDPQEEYKLVEPVFGLASLHDVKFPTTEVFKERYAD
jgi:hypothetical protein